MGLLEAFKQKANNPSIAGFNTPLLQQHPKRSAEFANQDKTEIMLANTLRPALKTFLEQHPSANKEEAAKFLIQGYNNKVEAEFTPEQKLAFNRYKEKHTITPFRFKVLWDRAESEFKGSRLKESAAYNFGQYANLFGADNLENLQQIEINRLKQNRGQGLFTKETGLDMLTDLPAWILPAGMIAKVGTKAFNVARSALGGAGMGAALGLKELNRDDVSFKHNAMDMGFGALTGGLLNAG
ncbi:hypothetical protein, partial [Helicobacter sp.]|uniref:hypothetical protein n=1 Tax=Helicobacter sp. TaxID=218 RepID=UPI002A74C608